MKLQKYFFCFSFIGHLLIVLALIVTFKFHPSEKKFSYVPSYAYQEAPPVPPAQLQTESQQVPEKAHSQHGIEKPVIAKSQSIPSRQQMRMVKSGAENEPVHMLGEKGVVQPLLVLLGKALTAHIVYPKIAADFRVKGLVLIRLTLHPDGQVSDIELVRSSSADVLDQEALRGARAIATIPKVNIYLKQPKSMVVGLLFS